MQYFTKIILLSFFFIASNVSAGAPTCSASSGGYCAYTGKVSRIYVNSGNLILLYFDAAVALDVPTVAGYTISNGAAAAYIIDDNPEFAKTFYSTALAAQASGRNVSINMKGVQSGFLKFDRIWLEAP